MFNFCVDVRSISVVLGITIIHLKVPSGVFRFSVSYKNTLCVFLKSKICLDCLQNICKFLNS